MDEANHSDALRLDPDFPTELMLQTWRMWQLPLVIWTSWWNMSVEAMWPHQFIAHHAHFHEEHDQLVVPEPIEREGEHGLFA